MRFLYGDSTPFPLGYNFLSTLEAFMAAATRIVQLDKAGREQRAEFAALVEQRTKSIEALDQFHGVVMRAVQEAAQKIPHSSALEYAQKVGEFASQYVEQSRAAALAAKDREFAKARADENAVAIEQRQHLDVFLKVARLPALSTKMSMRLAVEGKEAHEQVTAVFDNPDGIQTSFALATSAVPAWSAPRKVSEFIHGAELMVGVDKSWLRGTVQPKQVNVDDWLIVSFEMSDDVFELTLQKKVVEKESLCFQLRRSEAGLTGTMEHPGAAHADTLPGNLTPDDLAILDRLWQAMKQASRELLSHKEKLLAVSLDGQAVFEAGLVTAFIVRLVTMFAPTVREIATRSPNESELSLKMEADGGRREELYLRREQLVSKLQPLSSDGRAVFAPLGLDTWVPGVTSPPPPVSTRGGE